MSVRSASGSADAGGKRALALAGVVGPLVYWTAVLVLGSLDPDYSHAAHAASLVGAVQAPFSPLGRAAFVLAGLLIVAFSVGLSRDRPPGRAATAGVAAVGIHGVGRIGEGVFAWNLVEPGGLTNALHLAFGVPAVLSMLVAPPLLAWAIRGDDRWDGYYGPTVVVAVGVLAVFLLVGPLPATTLVDLPPGVGQRVGFGLWYAWQVGLAVGLYRRAAGEGRTA
jgi:hypothetical membrane protein